MGVLTDIVEAVENYPHEYLQIEIVDVNAPGDVVNVGDDVTFRFRVSNSGPLHVEDLELLIEGLNGTEIAGSGAGAAWVDSFQTSAGWFPRVPAHSANNPVDHPGNEFHFRPTRAAARDKDLLRVSVAGWTSDGFAHVFAGHTRADAEAHDVYTSTVSRA